MVTVKFTCEDCETFFTLKYDENLAEGPPCLCPWCSSYISEEDESEPDMYDTYDQEDDQEDC